tara:strand:+ start:13948 stop:15723 length:1776 start_codon:yes stop_codon:yes gene_type:complete
MHLVVSKNKITWTKDKPILFAGSWCYPKSTNDKAFILHDDKIEINYSKIDEDWKKIFEYKNRLFPIICSVLNDHRNENHSERYYRILIGHWFDYAIEILFNKTLLALSLKEQYDLKSFSYLFSENYSIAPYSESEFMDAHFDDRWNQALFGMILECLNFKDFKISRLSDLKTSEFSFSKNNKNLLKNTMFKINHLFGRLSSNDDALIINSYLPIFEELKLKLYLKQIPIVTSKVSYNSNFTYDHNLRNHLTEKLLSRIDETDTLFYAISQLIFFIYPIIYLEGYEDVKNFVDKLNWPKNPKFIFTSNNFFADNIFKLWAAQKINKNIKFFVGQHGPYWLQINSINDQVYSSCEEITADKLICNGDENSDNKVSGLYFPISKPKKISYDKSGNISFIVPPLAYFGYKKSWSQVYWDNFKEYEIWSNKVTKLFNSLDKDVKKFFYLRLYFHIIQHNFVNKIWQKKIGFQNIYSNNYSIKNIYKKSRLVIICFESRSLQETMVQEIPTLVLFDKFMIKQMRKENLKNFNILKRAGILFTDFEKAVDFLNQNFNSIESWWNSQIIQKARKEFADKYSKTNKSPAKFLSNVLLENL